MTSLVDPDRFSDFMRQALIEAAYAQEAGEVPVGAVVVFQDQIIARGHNLTRTNCDPTAHAEIVAIRKASAIVGDWRLNSCALFVTLEPCTMCIGAIKISRIPLLVFGARDEKAGAVGSIYDLSVEKKLGPALRVIGEIEEKRSSEILSTFFATRRTFCRVELGSDLQNGEMAEWPKAPDSKSGIG